MNEQELEKLLKILNSGMDNFKDLIDEIELSKADYDSLHSIVCDINDLWLKIVNKHRDSLTLEHIQVEKENFFSDISREDFFKKYK